MTLTFPTRPTHTSFINQLQGLLKQPPPFDYPINITLKRASNPHANVMACFHGYGGSHHFVAKLQHNPAITDHLISFNFPDFGIKEGAVDPYTTTFGTIDELLPALYVLKKCIVDGGLKAIKLYGFSAGGGAAVNVIAVLQQSRFDHELTTIGINEQEKQTMLQAIQRGYIILDCPLKSVDEIIDFRRTTHELSVIAQRYKKNDLDPIQSLRYLQGLALNVIVHFQIPDEILSNRDDELFIQKLQDANRHGKTIIVIGHDGGHNSVHTSLWNAYQKFIQEFKS